MLFSSVRPAPLHAPFTKSSIQNEYERRQRAGGRLRYTFAPPPPPPPGPPGSRNSASSGG